MIKYLLAFCFLVGGVYGQQQHQAVTLAGTNTYLLLQGQRLFRYPINLETDAYGAYILPWSGADDGTNYVLYVELVGGVPTLVLVPHSIIPVKVASGYLTDESENRITDETGNYIFLPL